MLRIKNAHIPTDIVQGGMGAGVSLHGLAKAVAKCGGLGVISSAGLHDIVSARDGKSVSHYEAVRIEIEKAKEDRGPIGINIMCALVGTYEAAVKAALDARVDAIISGAGLPLTLPTVGKVGNTALIPIVSSARALQIIVKRWEKQGYRPDAVVLEGPLAGGHLGFARDQIFDPAYALDKLLPPVLEVAAAHGNFPVIVAGGIYSRSDIDYYLALGASGAQMGTRFLATHESSASCLYKQAVLKATAEDIVISMGSPCGLPFRTIASSPLLNSYRAPKCNRGYVLQRDASQKLSVCPAKPNSATNHQHFCICNGLLASAGYAPEELPLYTVGATADRIDRIVWVSELMKELCPHLPIKNLPEWGGSFFS